MFSKERSLSAEISNAIKAHSAFGGIFAKLMALFGEKTPKQDV